jgi:hypothetical protein
LAAAPEKMTFGPSAEHGLPVITGAAGGGIGSVGGTVGGAGGVGVVGRVGVGVTGSSGDTEPVGDGPGPSGSSSTTPPHAAVMATTDARCMYEKRNEQWIGEGSKRLVLIVRSIRGGTVSRNVKPHDVARLFKPPLKVG